MAHIVLKKETFKYWAQSVLKKETFKYWAQSVLKKDTLKYFYKVGFLCNCHNKPLLIPPKATNLAGPVLKRRISSDQSGAQWSSQQCLLVCLSRIKGKEVDNL